MGRPNPAEVLLHRHVQAMVESALNDPVAALELEHPPGLQLLQRQTAEQKHHFARPVAGAFNARFQARRQSGPWKAGLAGAHFQALQRPDFQAAPIVFPFDRPGGVAGWRGEKAVVQTGFAGWFGGWVGWL